MRLTEIWHLQVAGQLIRTTGEHPFYAYDKGWTPAQELTPEDWILTDSGDWKPVNEIWNTGELETVYNLRVADHHTYFVGDESWGWSAWVHNAYTVQHLRPGTTDGVSLFHADDWHVYEGDNVKANSDRVVQYADAKSIFVFQTCEQAIQACTNQHGAETNSNSGKTLGLRFERYAKRKQQGVIRSAELIMKLDRSAATEVDFQTGSQLFECGTSFDSKRLQLIRLCVVARIRGKSVVGIYAEANPDRFSDYTTMLNEMTFWSPEVQTILQELVANPSEYYDDRSLGNYLAEFRHQT